MLVKVLADDGIYFFSRGSLTTQWALRHHYSLSSGPTFKIVTNAVAESTAAYEDTAAVMGLGLVGFD